MDIDNSDAPSARIAAITAETERINRKTARINRETAHLNARTEAKRARMERRTQASLRILDIAMAGQGLVAAFLLGCSLLSSTELALSPFTQSVAILFICVLYTVADRKAIGSLLASLSSVIMLTAVIAVFAGHP